MTEVSNIDDVLASSYKPAVESKLEPEPEQEPDYDEPEPLAAESEPEPEEPETQQEAKPVDDYGNERPVENEVIRERLRKQAESMERRHQAELDNLRQQLSQQGASPQVQQAAKDFEYDANAQGDWQQQLKEFVKHTVTSMTQEQAQAQQKANDYRMQKEFETKFQKGMDNFNDFVEVVGGYNITDAMTVATRSLQDPAAFLYAAAKREPQELERISKLHDPYAQIREIGRLEERMRKNKSTTNAPRPINRLSEDATTPAPKKSKEPSIEQLIAASEKKKMDQLRARRK